MAFAIVIYPNPPDDPGDDNHRVIGWFPTELAAHEWLAANRPAIIELVDIATYTEVVT